MEDVEMEAVPLSVQEDFSSVVLAKFSNSDNEHHLQICAAIGVMAQELRDQNLPLTPITYFGATCSSLDRLSSSVDPAGHLLDALLTILSIVINKFSPAVLKKKYVYLSTLLIQTLRVKSIGINGVIPGLMCASRLLMVREKVEWAELEQLYGVLISYITDDRPKVRKQSHLRVLKSSGRELFSVLAGVYSKVSKDTVGILQCAIRELASISDKEVVKSFYLTTMKKLLIVTREASKSKDSKNSNLMQVDNSNEGSVSAARAQLFDIAVSLLPGLDSKEIDALFSAVQPALKDDDGLIQKKAYRVLSMIFQYSDDFISRKLEVLLTLMIEVLPSCHFSAKRHRLDCLYFLVVHVSKEGSEQRRHTTIAYFLTEIILALKEANKKIRTRAYDILVQIGHACGDEEKGGKKENLLQYFYMVAGGLASETPHIVSAAMTGLARLAYEFSDLISAAYSVLPSTYLLMKRKNKEIIKANLGMLKVLVAKSPAEGLQTHLRGMVEGLLNLEDSTRSLFKAEVKLLLAMLVKKCGLDAVKEVMPEEHMKLLTNIRKVQIESV